MRDEMEFDVLLDSVLLEVSHAEPGQGFEQRLMRGISVAPVVAVLSGGIEEAGLWRSLWRGLRELVTPEKLPTLVLESRPLMVPDRMAAEGGYHSTAYAVGLHAAAILLIGFVVRAQIREVEKPRESVAEVVSAPAMTEAVSAKRIGGGGGQPGMAPALKGRLPRLAQEQIVPPTASPMLPPKIAIEPSVVVQKDLKMADNVLPNLGVPNSPLVGQFLGNGRGTGIGAGDGPGIGRGAGGNVGDGLRQVGGSVSKPEVVYAVEPEFSEEARKAKFTGNPMVYLWVDEHGLPSHVRIAKGVGMGLDEKAVEAVKQYRFKPAMENGRPVRVEMYIEVDFHIY